jgi:3-dehydroquinate dehydratase/shikimate dehydrogenase
MIALGPLADYLDVELSLWRRSANIRQKIGLAARSVKSEYRDDVPKEAGFGGRRKLILSEHDLATRPAKLESDLLEMTAVDNCAAVKIAWRARTVRDNFEAFELMRASPKPAIVICMGEDGLASRVLARKFGAFATFASLGPGQATAEGQISLKEMKRLYRWDALDARSRVFGLIGDPVRHSLSPSIHNAGFQAADINAVYLPFRVDPTYESFKAFMVEVLARPWLDIGGFSVTVPHKEHALRYMQESGRSVDRQSERIGAVNTLVLGVGGEVSGFNTDAAAAMDAIRQLAPGTSGELTGKVAVILGAGGVARAVIAGLTEAGALVTVFNRDAGRAASLAARFGCRAAPWQERITARSALLVNCTSVGMAPHFDESPMPSESVPHHESILDTVYTPRMTRLVREAAASGIPAAGGLGMFIAQAEAQFKLWTGGPVAPGVFARAVEEPIAN